MIFKNIKKVDDNEGGFTLIELLVVILIIGILSAIAIPVFLNQRQTAVDSSVQMDLKQAATVVETWQINHPRSAISEASLVGIKTSEGNTVTLVSSSIANGYVLCGKNENGKVSKTGYTYRSLSGGLKEEAC